MARLNTFLVLFFLLFAALSFLCTDVLAVEDNANTLVRRRRRFKLKSRPHDIGRFRHVPGVRTFRYLGGTLKISSSLQGGVGAASTSLSDYDGWAYGRGFSVLYKKKNFVATLGGGVGGGGNGGLGSGAGGGILGGGAGAGAGGVDGAGVGIGIGGGFSIDGKEVWGFGFGDAVGFNGGGGGGAGGTQGGCAQAGGGESGGLNSDVTVACGGRGGAKSASITNVELFTKVEDGKDAFEGAGAVVGSGGAAGAAAGLSSGARAVGFGNGVPDPEGKVEVEEGEGEAVTEKEAAAAAAVGQGSIGGFSKVVAITKENGKDGEDEPSGSAVADGGRTIAAAAAAGKGQSSGSAIDGSFGGFTVNAIDRLTKLSTSISEELVSSIGDDSSRAIAGEFGMFAYKLVDDFLRLSLDSAGLLKKRQKNRTIPWRARRILLGRSGSIPLACIRKRRGRCRKSKYFRERFRYNQKTIMELKKSKHGYDITTFVSQESKAVI